MELTKDITLEQGSIVSPSLSPEDGWVEIPKKRGRNPGATSGKSRAEAARKKKASPGKRKQSSRTEIIPVGMKRWHASFMVKRGSEYHVFLNAKTQADAERCAKDRMEKALRMSGKLIRCVEVDERGWKRHPLTEYEKHWRI